MFVEQLEKLAVLVEQRWSAGLAGTPSFLVLTRALLLSLGELSETQHLITAQRVYALLERPLLDVIRRDDNDASVRADTPSGSRGVLWDTWAAACSSVTPQEAEGPASVPASFSEALALYLKRLERQPGERLDREFGSVLMALLRDFVSSLRCHDASFKGKDPPLCDGSMGFRRAESSFCVSGEAWWNPEKMDANACCYLGLICRLFSIMACGAAEGPVAGSCRELMKLLVQVRPKHSILEEKKEKFLRLLIEINEKQLHQVHLQEPMMLFRFLCLLWGYSGNQGDQLDVKVGAVLQTRALYMGRALMDAQPAATLNELAAADSPGEQLPDASGKIGASACS